MAKNCCSKLTAMPFPVYVPPPVSPHAHSPSVSHSPGKQPAGSASKTQATSAAGKLNDNAEKVSETDATSEVRLTNFQYFSC